MKESHPVTLTGWDATSRAAKDGTLMFVWMSWDSVLTRLRIYSLFALRVSKTVLSLTVMLQAISLKQWHTKFVFVSITSNAQEFNIAIGNFHLTTILLA